MEAVLVEIVGLVVSPFELKSTLLLFEHTPVDFLVKRTYIFRAQAGIFNLASCQASRVAKLTIARPNG